MLIAAIRYGVPYWATLPLILIAAGLLVRTFIIFHDCCHGSFLPSRRANKILGYITGVLTFTPYDEWQHEHAVHHATSGDLTRRGVGDIWTMTVEEYTAAPWKTRLGYRLFRHPLALFILGPGVMFMILQRIPHRDAGPRGRSSVALTNLGILALLALASVLIGLRTVLLIQVPIITIAAAVGAWLFYVQHQYEGVYWARREEWDPVAAALDGSSYYELPKLLQWFSGNIGFHHIHHLRPRIPNYHLEECFKSVPALQAVRRLTLAGSLRCIRLHLWDEAQQKLVGWSGA